MQKTDPRTTRSRKLLIQALIHCMETKNASNISVRELTEAAELNRATFYLHYQDMPDFFDKLMTQTLEGLLNAANSGKPLGNGLYSQHIFYTNYFKYIKENQCLFQALLGKNGLPEFRRRLIQVGVNAYTALLEPFRKKLEEHIALDILVWYIISAHIGLIEYWLRSNCKYSPEYMATQVHYLTVESLHPIAALREELDLPL